MDTLAEDVAKAVIRGCRKAKPKEAEQLRFGWWRFVLGVPAEGGYRAAHEDGGFEEAVTPCLLVVLIENGTVAIPPA